jgi:hypothetical protein
VYDQTRNLIYNLPLIEGKAYVLFEDYWEYWPHNMEFGRACAELAQRYKTTVSPRWLKKFERSRTRVYSDEFVFTDGLRYRSRGQNGHEYLSISEATYIICAEYLPRGQGLYGSGVKIKWVNAALGSDFLALEAKMAQVVFGSGADADFIEVLTDQEVARRWLQRMFAEEIEGGSQPHVFTVDGITVTMCGQLPKPQDKENHCLYAIAQKWGWQIFGRVGINNFQQQASFANATVNEVSAFSWLISRYERPGPATVG